MTTQAAAAETAANGADAAALAELQELEAKARRQGWRPKDEFRGNPDTWIDAPEFLARIDAEAPLKNDRLRYLDDKLNKALKSNERLERTVQEQGTFIKTHVTEIVNRGRRAEAGAYERQRLSLKAQMKAAMKSQDEAEYDRLERSLEELESNPPQIGEDDEVETKPKVVEQRQPTEQEVEETLSLTVRSWIETNKAWFKTDKEMAAKAVALHGVNMNAGMSEEKSLAQVDRDMRNLFPHKFENDRREVPSSVTTKPSPPSSRVPKTRTVQDLPAEAQLALSQLKRLIPGYTDKQYLDEYKWEN